MHSGIQASAARRLAVLLVGHNFPSTRSQVFLESARPINANIFGFYIEHGSRANVRGFFTVTHSEITASSWKHEFSGQRSASRCWAGANMLLQSLRPGPLLSLVEGGEYKEMGADTKIEKGSGVLWTLNHSGASIQEKLGGLELSRFGAKWASGSTKRS
jgi:hypothetical protein